MADTFSVGRWGETCAQTYLTKIGFKIIARNWRFKNRHEIDIVAIVNNELVAVEVKTHAHLQSTKPFEQVTKRKTRQIQQALELFAKEHSIASVPFRIDVISIIRDPYSLEHFRSVGFAI